MTKTQSLGKSRTGDVSLKSDALTSTLLAKPNIAFTPILFCSHIFEKTLCFFAALAKSSFDVNNQIILFCFAAADGSITLARK